jgi:putative membrane protein
MRILPYFGLVTGLIIFTLLIVWQGISDIINLLLSSGWYLLLLPVVWAPSLFAAVISWRLLFPKSRIPPFKHLFTALWIGRAINTLLPVATIGGEIAKARLVTIWGNRGIDASASVLVDKTVQALAIVPWGFIGAILLIHLAVDDELAKSILIAISLLGFGIAGFILVQRAGMFGYMAKFFNLFIRTEKWDGITNNAHEVDRIVRDLYRDKFRFALSVFWRTLNLILQSGEVWLACYLLGHPVSLIEALMLKSLTSIMSDIAFFIPNAYGIQEGGYIMLGVLIGLTPDFSLAVSLATRIRELIIDLPGVLVWQHIEGKLLLNKHRSN